MSIKRTMLLTSMALALVAFAAPSFAQANVKLTDPKNTTLPTGAKVTATSKNLKTTTNKGQLSCALVTLHLELLTNGPNHVTLAQLGDATTDKCHLLIPVAPFTLPVTITDGTLGVGEKNVITFNTWGTANTQATFISHTYQDEKHEKLISTCDFHGNIHAQASAVEEDLLEVPGSKLVGTSVVGECPTEGTIKGEFTLETTNGTPVTIDFSKTG